jgi:chitinase
MAVKIVPYRFFTKATASFILALFALQPSTLAQSISEPFESQLYNCPEHCTNNITTGAWTTYHDVNRLKACNKTLLLDIALYNGLDDVDTDVTIRSCTATLPKINRRDDAVTTCGSAIEVQAQLQIASGIEAPGIKATFSKADAIAAISQLQNYLSRGDNCNNTIAFAYSGTAAVGIYSGAKIHNLNTANSAIKSFIEKQINGQSSEISSNLMMQWCGSSSAPQTGDYKFGIIVSSSTALPLIQESVRTWREAKCLNEGDGIGKLSLISTPMWLTTPLPRSSNSTSIPESARAHTNARSLTARADCRTIQVVSGDSCGALATKCGISASDFTKFNPASNLCSTLAIGQYVCCSSGTLPDLTPKPNADGSCATYTVQSGE